MRVRSLDGAVRETVEGENGTRGWPRGKVSFQHEKLVWPDRSHYSDSP